MKKIFLFLIFFLALSSKSFSNNKITNLPIGCDFEINSQYIKNLDRLKIKKIEIDTHNYRRWTVNSVRIITNRFRFTPDEYRKRFDATVSVTYEDNTKCNFTGRIRHSGDAKDHIALHDNSIIQSLDIHLNDGNIRGITRFKLFKPDTRGILEDVIIQSELLRSLKYLAPRSIKVEARINQAVSTMLFQEKASKELLEFNNRREGPILEGDQKFFFKLVENIPSNQLSNWDVGMPILRSKSIKTMLAKQTNAEIINKSQIHKEMSYNSLSNLNLIYLYYSNKFQDEKNNFQFFDYDLDNQLLGFFDYKNVLRLNVYNLLMQSTNSQHALSSSNRKFYWNSIENYYEPINYDSNPDIGGFAPSTTTSVYRLPMTENFFEAFSELEKKLNNLNITELTDKTNNSGLNLSVEYLNLKIDKILLNLSKVKTNYLNIDDKELIEHNKFKPIDSILTNFNKTLNEIDPNVYLVKHNSKNGQLQRCKIYLNECEDYIFSKENLSNLLEGELIIENKVYQYLGRNLNFKGIINQNIYNELKIKNSKIFFDSGIDIEINSNENIVDIYQNKSDSRLYITGGILENLTINYYGKKVNKDNKKNLKNFPINISGLTGCLSLVNLEVKNLSINANNSNCEDAVNLINVRGTLKDINIKNSLSDGLDIDFSNLSIESITVSSSGNDCVDFSAGIYKLKDLKLYNCGDKALSVGEKSFLTLNNIIAENTSIGIASKDSSIVKLNSAYFKKLKTCVAAYNKKQEFNGGFIEIFNMECNDYNNEFEIDKFSKIIKKNESL
ncbi:MAG: hypothetical protein ACJZ3C_04640 [Pelagibacteraceae bacterium]